MEIKIEIGYVRDLINDKAEFDHGELIIDADEISCNKTLQFELVAYDNDTRIINIAFCVSRNHLFFIKSFIEAYLQK